VQVLTDVDSATRFGFGGGYTDNSGLVYLVNRYYDPGWSQFISVDIHVKPTCWVPLVGKFRPTTSVVPSSWERVRSQEL